MSRGLLKHTALMMAALAMSAVAHAQSATDLWKTSSTTTTTTQPAASDGDPFNEQATQRTTTSSGDPFKEQPPQRATTNGGDPFKEQPPQGRSVTTPAADLWKQDPVQRRSTDLWRDSAPPARTTDYDLPPPPPPPAEMAQEKKQQKLEAQSGADCEECKPKPGQIQLLGQFANRYAELASRSLVSKGVAKVMNVIYQRCDADNESMLVTPSYYNPSFHNDDSKDGGQDNKYHHYKGASEMEPGDMPSYNSDDTAHREWFSHRVASSVGGMFYTQKDYAPGCMNMREKPPVFCDGGRSQFGMASGGQASVNLFNSSPKIGRCSSPNFTTMDCSDLVSSVYIATGLKFYKNQPASTPVTTATLKSFLHPRPNACMGPAQFAGHQSLQSGDVVLFNTNHSLIIDHVGTDPYGLNKMSPNVPCTRIDPKNFDITIVQAGVFGGRMGPSRIRYQDLLTTNATSDENQAALIKLAIKACEAARSNTTEVAAVSVWKKGDDDGAHVLRAVGLNDPQCYVHKPATHPDCKNPSSYECHQPWGAKMKGEECLNNCSFDESQTEGTAK